MPSVSQAHPTPAGKERRKKKNQFKWNLRYQYSNIFFFFQLSQWNILRIKLLIILLIFFDMRKRWNP